jgi:hypothetical protein
LQTERDTERDRQRDRIHTRTHTRKNVRDHDGRRLTDNHECIPIQDTSMDRRWKREKSYE